MNSPSREHFEVFYAGRPPWDVDGPQTRLREVADQIEGSLLDAGCGTGENALFFAARGVRVTAIDFLDRAIAIAQQKAADRGVVVDFRVLDATNLASLSETYDAVIDSGLFHVFDNDDRKRYVDGLATVLKPGGRLYMLCFSKDEPAGAGPRRISRETIEQTFAEPDWAIETIEPTRFDVRNDVADVSFSPGGPKAWFVKAQRQGPAR